MKVIVKSEFRKDLSKVVLKKLYKDQIEKIVKFALRENFLVFCKIFKCKKLKGYERFYRIRVGDYRIGFEYKNDTIIFWRFLHRKDIYKFFP